MLSLPSNRELDVTRREADAALPYARIATYYRQSPVDERMTRR